MARGFVEETCVVQLKQVNEKTIILVGSDIEEKTYEDKTTKDFYENPFNIIDNRILIWESKRPKQSFEKCINTQELINFKNILTTLEVDTQKVLIDGFENRNGAVVEYTPLASATLGCNTSSIPLGSLEQSKASLFYVTDYVVKNDSEIATSLAVIKHAINKQKLYPSIAEDSGTEIRNGKYFMSIVLNKLSGLKEISDGLNAALLINLETFEATIKTTYIFINNAMACVKQREIEDKGCKDASDAWCDIKVPTHFDSDLNNSNQDK
jgi:hypothetical protein